METLAEALEREHRDIDAGIEEYTAGLAAGESRVEPMTRAMTALRRHIYLEEEFLFPPMRSGGLMAPVFVMIREHGEMWRTMDALQALLSDESAGDAGASVQERCTELVAELQAHNPKEEQILYPQADAVLTGAPGEQLRTFLDSGLMAPGWVCEGARGGAAATPW